MPSLRLLLLAATAVALLSHPAAGQAGLLSPARAVVLRVGKPSVVDVSLHEALVGIQDPKAGHITPFDAPVLVTTTWNVATGGTVALVASFANADHALTNGQDWLPAALVEARTAGSAFGPLTERVPGVASEASRLLWSETLFGPHRMGARTDRIELQLNLTGVPSVPPGPYTGTLLLRAVTY